MLGWGLWRVGVLGGYGGLISHTRLASRVLGNFFLCYKYYQVEGSIDIYFSSFYHKVDQFIHQTLSLDNLGRATLLASYFLKSESEKMDLA